MFPPFQQKGESSSSRQAQLPTSITYSQQNGESSSNRRPLPTTSQSSSSRQRQPTSSRSKGAGIGLGLDYFSRASDGDEWSDSDEEDGPEPGTDLRTDEQRAENELRVRAATQARATITNDALAAKGITWFGDEWPYADDAEFLPVRAAAFNPQTTLFNPQKGSLKTLRRRHDFFSNLANTPELFMELAKHLRIKDLISLYAISIDFHETINGHLSHCMKLCAEYMAPDCAKLYPFMLYAPLCVPDPAGRPHMTKDGEVRMVPGLKWLQMVVHREKAVRDILACMARQGHRMKPGMALSLKKMWVLMDISTTRGRVNLMHNRRMFTDMDLYNIQFFIVKLDMRFNDPVDGPGDDAMRKLFLGQRGLTPLCKLLKRTAFLDVVDIVRLGVRYAYVVRPEHRRMPIFGVPPEEIGVAHTEGWGAGRVHLMRPDELVMVESVRRQLGLKNHIMEMMIWGYVDPITGKDIPVTEEEMYMSDDEGLPSKNPDFNPYFEFERQEGDPEDYSGEEGDEESDGQDSDGGGG